MLTWLDHMCRQTLPLVDAKWHNGDPRKAFGSFIHRLLRDAQQGTMSFDNILDEAWYTMLSPFAREYIPTGATLRLADGTDWPHPLGLVLTRAAASLLSGAESSRIPDETWRSALGPNRVVYVDVPHGAILLNVGVDTNDILQLRAIVAAPSLPPDMPEHTLFVAQMTDRGSERGRGRIAGVLCPDGKISRFGSPKTGPSATDWTLRPPFVHPLTDMAVLGRAGTFLRLVLAYHCFGPRSARESIAATPAGKLRGGKPRKDESLFALTRLRESSEVGRSKETIQDSWSLTSHQEVAGHFKLQPYGPQRSMRRLIWVDGYGRGPDEAPVKPRAYLV
jgi:hypothetical protein